MEEEEKEQPQPAQQPSAEDTVIKEGKIFAVLAYLGILCLVPLLFKKENAFALFHGKQGLILFIGEVAIGVIGMIPLLGWFLVFIGMVLFPILSLIGIIQALIGNYWRIPVFADIADKINI